MKMFILSKLFGNSTKSLNSCRRLQRSLWKLWARMVVFIWGMVGYCLFLLVSQLPCVSQLILQLT